MQTAPSTQDPAIPTMQTQIAALQNHTHDGVNSLQLDPRNFLGVQVTNVVPTGAALGGTWMFYDNGSDQALYAMLGGNWVNLTGGGVTSIVAGTNISISPSGGTGAVTVNASGSTYTPVFGSGGYEFGNFATTNITIAHGLGKTPISATVNAYVLAEFTSNIPVPVWSIGTYNGTTNQCLYQGGSSGLYQGSLDVDGSHAINLTVNSASSPATTLVATLTWDSTNLYFAFTKSGTYTAFGTGFFWTATA